MADENPTASPVYYKPLPPEFSPAPAPEKKQTLTASPIYYKPMPSGLQTAPKPERQERSLSKAF